MFRFFSVTIAGILLTELVGYSRTAAGVLLSLPGNALTEAWLAVSQPRERTYAGMKTDKERNVQDTQSFSLARNTTQTTGEPPTVGEIYERFRRPIHSYIFRLLGSQEDADDITQEVFIRAFTAWNDLYDRENLSAWLYKIATNLCVDQMRRRKRISWWPLSRRKANSEWGETYLEEENSYLPASSGGIPEIAERDHIRQALASMPQDYAIALILNAAQGVPYQEIAEIVGISPNAAATRISRAKRMFAEHYERLSKQDAAADKERGPVR
ncbi:MAG TPA: RNA polymerase sigma factor [Ktedonobacteraceae bacterium]|nr:RNA polymerase sigma factor [Ktedonobacteraceae bacterium]